MQLRVHPAGSERLVSELLVSERLVSELLVSELGGLELVAPELGLLRPVGAVLLAWAVQVAGGLPSLAVPLVGILWPWSARRCQLRELVSSAREFAAAGADHPRQCRRQPVGREVVVDRARLVDQVRRRPDLAAGTPWCSSVPHLPAASLVAGPPRLDPLEHQANGTPWCSSVQHPPAVLLVGCPPDPLGRQATGTPSCSWGPHQQPVEWQQVASPELRRGPGQPPSCFRPRRAALVFDRQFRLRIRSRTRSCRPGSAHRLAAWSFRQP